MRDHVQKGIVELRSVSIEDQLSDLVTKLVTKDKLIYVREGLGMFPVEWSLKSMCEALTHH